MTRLHCLVLVLVVLSWVCLPSLGAAEGVNCPVCGESFGEDVAECPNDGSDLKVVGLKKGDSSEKGDSNSDTESYEASTAEAAEDQPAKSELSEEDSAEETLIYRRRDRRGGRKPTPEKKRKDFSDRRSRILNDKRGTKKTTKRPKAKPVEVSIADTSRDSWLRADFEKRRAHSWLRREELVLKHQGELARREEARAQLLNGLGAPLASIGGRVFFMPEGTSTGPVACAEIDINPARYRFRAGFSTLIGVRALTTRNEIVFLEQLAVGMQLPWRFSPYLTARVGVGLLATERFGVSRVGLMTTVGAEIGVDSWISPWMTITPSVGYMRITVDNLYWHTVTMKLSIGY